MSKDTVEAERKFVKWEYHRLYIDTGEDVSGKLSDAGSRGWELVSCLHAQGTLHHSWFYFKRPIIENNERKEA